MVAQAIDLFVYIYAFILCFRSGPGIPAHVRPCTELEREAASAESLDQERLRPRVQDLLV